jgi:ribonuclease P protein component
MVSVPKRLFKRAVRRNLYKRRMREAYRTQKALLEGVGADILFLYNTREDLPFEEVRAQVETILKRIGNEAHR